MDDQEGSPLRVLVVDDDPVIRTVTLMLLRHLGAQAEAVNDGKAGVAAVQAGRFDVVLMDIQMPVMGGLEAVREILRTVPAERRPRIIASTALGSAADREKYVAEGMDGFLQKPITADNLRAALGLPPA